MVLVCAQVVQCTTLVPSGTHAEPANGPWAKKISEAQAVDDVLRSDG